MGNTLRPALDPTAVVLIRGYREEVLLPSGVWQEWCAGYDLLMAGFAANRPDAAATALGAHTVITFSPQQGDSPVSDAGSEPATD